MSHIARLNFDHKGFPTVLNSVSPGPLSRKSIAFLFPLLEGPVMRLLVSYQDPLMCERGFD